VIFGLNIFTPHVENADPDARYLPYPSTEQRTIMEEFALEMLTQIDNVRNKLSDPSSVRVCLVLDGEALPAKHATHKSRQRNSYNYLKEARRTSRNFLGRPTSEDAVFKFRTRFHKCAQGWVRWFDDIKKLLVEALCANHVDLGFDSSSKNQYSVVVAPYEADPVCVYIAHQFPKSVIFSNDGDLLVYPYATLSPVCYRPESLVFVVISTKIGRLTD